MTLTAPPINHLTEESALNPVAPDPTPVDPEREALYDALEHEIRKHGTFIHICHYVLDEYYRELRTYPGLANRGRHLAEPCHPDDDPETDRRLYWLIHQANKYRAELVGLWAISEPEDARRRRDPDTSRYSEPTPEEYVVR